MHIWLKNDNMFDIDNFATRPYYSGKTLINYSYNSLIVRLTIKLCYQGFPQVKLSSLPTSKGITLKTF